MNQRGNCFIITLLTTIVTTNPALAGQSSLTANYPAPQASYTQIILKTNRGVNPDCTLPVNRGTLFIDTMTGQLGLCDNNVTKFIGGQGCFSRFCDNGVRGCSSPPTSCTPPPCPSGYNQTGTTTATNTFITSTDGSGNCHWVTATTCCQPSPLAPS